MKENVCRICLLQSVEDQHYVTLLESELVMEIYQNITGIQVQTFDVIQTICSDCKDQLIHFNDFRAKCIESDAILKHQVEIKSENEETKFENVEIDNVAPEAVHSPVVEDRKQPKKNWTQPRKYIVENGVKKYNCQICAKKFIKLGPLVKHEKKHEQKSLVFCELCGIRLSSSRALRTHKIFKHSEHRPFSCTFCSLTFKAKCGLKEHNAVRHNTERKFVCDICSWTSKTLKTLRRHIMRVHLTEKTVPCDICLVKFKDKKTLDQHFLIHTDIRPFVCDKCSRGFVQISSLSKHIKICGKTGKIRSQPIKCNDCIKRLASTKTLLNHRLKCHKDLYRTWGDANNGIRFIKIDKEKE